MVQKDNLRIHLSEGLNHPEQSGPHQSSPELRVYQHSMLGADIVADPDDIRTLMDCPDPQNGIIICQPVQNAPCKDRILIAIYEKLLHTSQMPGSRFEECA